MKILAILTGAMLYDGITNSVYQYYAAMDRGDMEIHVVSSRSTLPEMQRKFEALGCTVHRLECRDSHPLRYLSNLTRLIRRERFDIVHAHGNSATLSIEMLSAKLAGCRVRIVHSRNSACEHARVDRLLRPLLYATYTDGFACGEKAGQWLFGRRPFTVIRNGKDVDRFLFNAETRQAFRNKLGAGPEDILLGHVGLFHRQKNHAFLLEVFAAVRRKSDRYRLVLIGEGEEMDAVRRQAEALGVAGYVTFLGRQSNVEQWLQALDLMVFPSWFEGMPNVVLEWQLAGLPVLLSDRITRECRIVEGVKYLPLELGADGWAEEILSAPLPAREGRQEEIRAAFAAAGFDIRANAPQLKAKYAELMEKRR